MAVSITVPTTEPTKAVAGDTWTWKRTLADYLPSDGWVLTYALVKTGKQITVTASDDSDDHLVEVIASTTAAYDPGIYSWHSYVTNSSTSERYRVEKGAIEVLPDFATQQTGYDDRSFAKKMVDAIESALENFEAHGVTSISVDGRAYTYASRSEMHTDYNYWKARYNDSERKAGRGRGRSVQVRF